MTILNCSNLSVGYQNLTLLSRITLTMEGGQIVPVVGANGAGKTTLLRTLANMHAPLEGTLRYAISSERITFAAQQLRLLKGLTVNELCGLAVSIHKRNPTLIPSRLETCGLQEMKNVLACHLSHGQQRMLSLALAWLSDAMILFLDEPSSDLDETNVARLHHILSHFKASGKMCMFSTHRNSDLDAYPLYLTIEDKKLFWKTSPNYLLPMQTRKDTHEALDLLL